MSILAAVARGEAWIMNLLQALGLTGQPVAVPVLALAGARIGASRANAGTLLAGLLDDIDGVTARAVQDTGEALALAGVITRGGLDPWDAHAASVADREVCPILTLDPAKWRRHRNDLDEPLEFIEIADPEDPGA